ncbi:MAG TPA: hypothetical protein V6C85_10520 [Allocoleopsis sp.]
MLKICCRHAANCYKFLTANAIATCHANVPRKLAAGVMSLSAASAYDYLSHPLSDRF